MRVDLLLQTGATLALVGLIWIVQVVHYPLFARVGKEAWRAYHAAHTRLITFVVAPLMLTELVTALWMVADPVPGVPAGAAWAGLGLVAVCWMSTAGLQVPHHNRLSGNFDAAAHARLVRTNWVRTAAWSARGGLCLWMITVAA